MKKLILFSVFLTGCTVSGDKFSSLMRQEGIVNAVNTGYTAFGCSEDDDQHTGFQGIKNGVPVKGVICGQALGMKGYTLRYK